MRCIGVGNWGDLRCTGTGGDLRGIGAGIGEICGVKVREFAVI